MNLDMQTETMLAERGLDHSPDATIINLLCEEISRLQGALEDRAGDREAADQFRRYSKTFADMIGGALRRWRAGQDANDVLDMLAGEYSHYDED